MYVETNAKPLLPYPCDSAPFVSGFWVAIVQSTNSPLSGGEEAEVWVDSVACSSLMTSRITAALTEINLIIAVNDGLNNRREKRVNAEGR